MFCRHCGASLPEDAVFCPRCGQPLEGPQLAQPQPAQPYPAQDERPVNQLGLAGMITAIVALFVPFLGFFAAIAAIVLSGIGLSRRAQYRMNGFATAGLIVGILALLPTLATIVSLLISYAVFI